MTLYEVWDQVHQVLIGAAETIGVPLERISKGDFQKQLPIKPPGIIVNCEPGDFVNGQDPNPQAVTITIFFVTRPETTKPEAIAQAISDSISLGWRAFAVLRDGIPSLHYPSGGGQPPVKLDTVEGDLIASVFQGVMAFSA